MGIAHFPVCRAKGHVWCALYKGPRIVYKNKILNLQIVWITITESCKSFHLLKVVFSNSLLVVDDNDIGN